MSAPRPVRSLRSAVWHISRKMKNNENWIRFVYVVKNVFGALIKNTHCHACIVYHSCTKQSCGKLLGRPQRGAREHFLSTALLPAAIKKGLFDALVARNFKFSLRNSGKIALCCRRALEMADIFIYCGFTLYIVHSYIPEMFYHIKSAHIHILKILSLPLPEHNSADVHDKLCVEKGLNYQKIKHGLNSKCNGPLRY